MDAESSDEKSRHAFDIIHKETQQLEVVLKSNRRPHVYRHHIFYKKAVRLVSFFRNHILCKKYKDIAVLLTNSALHNKRVKEEGDAHEKYSSTTAAGVDAAKRWEKTLLLAHTLLTTCGAQILAELAASRVDTAALSVQLLSSVAALCCAVDVWLVSAAGAPTCADRWGSAYTEQLLQGVVLDPLVRKRARETTEEKSASHPKENGNEKGGKAKKSKRQSRESISYESLLSNARRRGNQNRSE